MPVNLAAIDLKLLVVFDAIMGEHSVSRAAHRLGMSQPAVSNALNRLRHLLKDQLFRRTAEGMKPTARAMQLATPVMRALRDIREALEPASFTPADQSMVFRLALSDHATVVVLPHLLPMLQRQAPQIRLEVLPKRNATLDQQLDSGEIDLALGIIPKLPRRFARQDLFTDEYVCMMHQNHPLAGKPISLKQFQASEHLALRPIDSQSVIDQCLKRHRISRKIVLNVTQYLAVPNALRKRHLITCILHTLAQQFDRNEFVISRMPIENFEPMNISIVWSRAHTHHAANAWLRQRITDVCRDLAGSGGKAL